MRRTPPLHRTADAAGEGQSRSLAVGSQTLAEERKGMTKTHRNTSLAVALAAVISFVWAVSTLWFGYPRLSSAAVEVNAMVLICLWAIGPAVWFAAEWRVWRYDGLAAAQQYARDFWIGAGAIVLLLAAGKLNGSQSGTTREYVVAWKLVVEVIRIVAWPVLAALGLILLRQPLSAFFNALGSRASKIGAFSVEFELSALPEARAWSGPSLDELKTEYPSASSDSSGGLFSAIADSIHADYLIVNLERGDAWLTSRLFILATLIPRVRPIKRIVFVGGVMEEFIGEAQPSTVAEALAQRFPWLGEAYLVAHCYIGNGKVNLRPNAVPLGRLDPQSAATVLGNFLHEVKGTATGSDWVDLGNYSEHAEWVNEESLRYMIGRGLEVGAVVKRDPSSDAVSLAKTLLRNDSAYVAIVDSVGRFMHLIDRYRALDQVVRREIG